YFCLHRDLHSFPTRRSSDLKHISYPYLDEEMPLLDAVIQRAKTNGVRSVMCDGEVIYQDGRFTRVDRDNALKTLHDELQRALSRSEEHTSELQSQSNLVCRL